MDAPPIPDDAPDAAPDLFGLSGKDKKRIGETPLMRQYWKIKERHPGAILLFRMGDFYETFDEDAVTVSHVLGITLTRRGGGGAADVPLAGFPHHALDTHLPRLVAAGHRVAVCEQLEDPKFARQVVKRGVVEVVTPGVSFRDPLLEPRHANYLAAVVWGEDRATKGRVGFAFLDASTGEFSVTEVEEHQIEALLQTVAPAEVLVDKRQKARLAGLRAGPFATTLQEDWAFSHDFAYETLLRHFQTHSLKGYGVEGLPLGLMAAGAALFYLGETQKGRVPHVRRLQRYRSEDYIALDRETKRNLELTAAMADGRRDGSLIGILDATGTPMGGRLLRSWLVRPLRDVAKINGRLDAVDALFRNPRLRRGLRDELRHVGDLERLVGKVCTGRATPRDLSATRLTLRQIPAIKALLETDRFPQESESGTKDSEGTGALRKIHAALTLCQPVVDRIGTTLVDEPPAQSGSGGFIREGFHAELDELRKLAHAGKDFLARLQVDEAKRTGIPSLKVGYNRVFGYYIEITHTHRDRVPPDYIRKQTLVGAERYVTPALKEYEEKILTAEEKAVEIETQLFSELRMAVADDAEAIQKNARTLGLLDVFAGLAEVAEKNGYVRPTVDDSAVLEIVGGRHPVVEKALAAGDAFIPNSVHIAASLEGEADEAERVGQIHLITGPNMAGKSVILRQTGLIVLLAQVGAFVPAERARVGVVDALFTRVGASDNLAAGESTFLVEMNETANILNNATPRSLILLDEVGRGTSTFDGLSIAWAVVEHLHEHAPVAARTLFATHYHELNALADRLPRVKSFRVQVQEHAGKVVFLRTLMPGGADHSYGIEVARMAGLPERVVARAKSVLHHLEAHDVAAEVGVADRPDAASGGDGSAPLSAPAARRTRSAAAVPAMGAPAPVTPDPALAELRARLASLDPNRLTPIEALLALAELRRIAEGLTPGEGGAGVAEDRAEPVEPVA